MLVEGKNKNEISLPSDCPSSPWVYTRSGGANPGEEAETMADNRSGDDKPMDLFSNTRPVFVFGAGFLIGLLVGLSIGLSVF